MNLPKPPDESSLASQLKKYGYLVEGVEQAQALKRFQRRHRLPVTGVEDKAVQELLSARFCGCSDSLPAQHRVVSSAYSASGCKWPKKDLYYYHQSFHPSLDKAGLKQTFAKACEAWEKVCGLKFYEAATLSRADIKVGWEQIDGAGGTLAYAYLPGSCGGDLAGTMRFDLGDRWQLGDGKSLWQTATHELGHIIGFYHSDRNDSIMWPYSTGGGSVISKDDAAGAVALYGPPRTSPNPTPTPGPVPSPVDAVELIPLLTASFRGNIANEDESKFFFIKKDWIQKASARGYTSIKVVLRTVGNADLDVYTRWKAPPVVKGELDSSDIYDQGSWTPTGAEEVIVKLDRSEDLYFQVHAYEQPSAFELAVTFAP